ncbi:MAG: type III secretion HpaP family protein [Chthoniobacterales bacterium]|nr:type III secretion HpaP family protein [Chthoniobacterales bacterium]
MSITKTSLATNLPEMQLHQVAQKSLQQREHLSSHQALSKTTPFAKQPNDIRQSDRKNLDHDAAQHENNFSNLHKSHHDKDSTTQFYTAKGDSKSAAKNRSVSEGSKLHNGEDKKVDGDEEENDQDFESHHHMTTHEALLSSAGQAISRMGFNNSSSNAENDNSDSDASEPAVENVSLPKTAQPKITEPSSSQKAVPDLAETLQKFPVSSSQTDPTEKESSTSKSEENPSLGVALSMGGHANSIAPGAKENALGGTAPTQPQDAAHLPGAEANRAANFLHELQANVGRFIASGEGKMTFQDLRSLPGTVLEITAHPSHLSVQFNTSDANTFNILNDLKNGSPALQASLAGQFAGQVFDVKNQLMTQQNSQYFGNEGERAREDIASFNQGNKGNRGSQEDT